MKVPYTHPESNSHIKILLYLLHLFLYMVFKINDEVIIYPDYLFFFLQNTLILICPIFDLVKKLPPETLGL